MRAVVRRADATEEEMHINRLLPGATDCVLLDIEGIGICAAAGYKPIGNSAILVVNVPENIDWMWKWEMVHFAALLPDEEYEAVYASETDLKIKWQLPPVDFNRVPFRDIPSEVRAELGEVTILARPRSRWSKVG